MASPNAPETGVPRPSIFIGSSTEGLKIAEQFRDHLQQHADVTIWRDAFTPGCFTLEALESALDKHSHAIIVLSPDDITKSRGIEEISPRDNAIFEAGLFIGRRGHSSVSIVIPEQPKVRLPTDLSGLIVAEYKIANGVDGVTYDVTRAVQTVAKSIEEIKNNRRRRSYERPSPFWDVASDTILILYGVESETEASAHRRARVSLRDLATSMEIKSFLDRKYPAKRVLLLPATTVGWEQQYTTADLVIVGGFVTNSEFAQHRAQYENLFRLRMGRLCVVDGQRINVPKFNIPNGERAPAIGDPQAIEDVPTEFTVRDFGYVFSGVLTMYGNERRVIAIAGVKGHGTRGAAAYLCRERLGIDAHLTRPLRANETLEAVVAVNVVRDTINTIESISVRVNDEIVVNKPAADAVACELGHPCDGCDFGLPRARMPKLRKLKPSKIDVIVFDLDDTLIDTFGLLITPLERRTAKAMIEAGIAVRDATTLACALLQCRRETPDDVRLGLKRSGIECSRAAFARRKKILEDVSLDHLVLSPEVEHLLRSLYNHFELYLLTSGSAEFQAAKIDKLEIRRYFRDIVVVAAGTYDVKARALQSLAADRGLAHDRVLVVGNRLDQEIAAANSLGMPTVWIRQGEGSAMLPIKGRREPDFSTDSVLRLPSMIWD
jgi:FMN phosphatase YigB (HAD superfamily)